MVESQSNEEKSIQEQSEAILKLLTQRGLLPDKQISDEARRAALQKRHKDSYHNTVLLLKNYRTIAWMVECFPEAIAEELERPFETVDKLLDEMEVAANFGNRKQDYRVAAVAQTRMLIDRVNGALTILKRKPGNGQKLFSLIYMTFIGPEKLSIQELTYRLDLSTRQYYRLKREAITVLSLRLWAASDPIVDLWLDILSTLGLGK